MRATGGPMSTKPYLAYLRAKYGELYRLDLAPWEGLDPATDRLTVDCSTSWAIRDRATAGKLPRLFSITARFTKAKSTRAALAERAPWRTPEWRPKYGPERNAIARDWKTRKTHHLAATP
jgi:hypothetical protein